MKRSEIWLINLDPTIGAEIRKIRPAVIISHDDLGVLPLKIVVPITEWKEHHSVASWMVQINPDKLNGLTKKSSADALQIRSVSVERFVKKVGIISIDILDQIEDAIGQVLNL